MFRPQVHLVLIFVRVVGQLARVSDAFVALVAFVVVVAEIFARLAQLTLDQLSALGGAIKRKIKDDRRRSQFTPRMICVHSVEELESGAVHR